MAYKASSNMQVLEWSFQYLGIATVRRILQVWIEVLLRDVGKLSCHASDCSALVSDILNPKPQNLNTKP